MKKTRTRSEDRFAEVAKGFRNLAPERLESILAKLEVASRAEAVAAARRLGILPRE